MKVGDGTLWPRSLLGKMLGSLGLGLAFAGRCLERLLQCSQFAAQPFLALLEPLLHQLLELPQLLAQLGLDVGLEDAHLTWLLLWLRHSFRLFLLWSSYLLYHHHLLVFFLLWPEREWL